MFAVIETGGKQYKVQVGDVVYIEKLLEKSGEKHTFNKVAFVVNGSEVKIGKPYVEGAGVVAEIVKTDKNKKIRVFKFKPKKNYKRVFGHRQFYTKCKILEIKS